MIQLELPHINVLTKCDLVRSGDEGRGGGEEEGRRQGERKMLRGQIAMYQY
jgi:hypothetical protein